MMPHTLTQCMRSCIDTLDINVRGDNEVTMKSRVATGDAEVRVILVYILKICLLILSAYISLIIYISRSFFTTRRRRGSTPFVVICSSMGP